MMKWKPSALVLGQTSNGLAGPIRQCVKGSEMKKIFFSVLGVTVLSISTLMAMSMSEAQAQRKKGNAVILTVVLDNVVAQSKAGQSASEQVESYRKSVVDELTKEQSSFETQVQSFQQNAELWAQDVRQKKEQELRLKQAQLPRMAQAMESVVTQTVQKARFDILKEAQPIIADIAEKQNATLILDRTTVVFAPTETDITQEVISKLDKKLKSVEVEKMSLADLKSRAEEAQKNQGRN